MIFGKKKHKGELDGADNGNWGDIGLPEKDDMPLSDDELEAAWQDQEAGFGAKTATNDEEAFLENLERKMLASRAKSEKIETPAQRSWRIRQELMAKNQLPAANIAKMQSITPQKPALTMVGGAAQPSAPSAKRLRPTPARDAELPERGSILHLATGHVVIYDTNVPDHGYQIVLMLHPNGSLSAEALNLRVGCQFSKIGQMPADDLEKMHTSTAWHRSHMLLHLDSYDDAHLIPQPTSERSQKPRQPRPEADALAPAAQAQRQAEPILAAGSNGKREKTVDGYSRGQRLRIAFSKDRAWEAIYWGHDDEGALVVHQTHGDLALMHLDLSRFKNEQIILGELMSEREVWETQEMLKRIYT